MTRTGNSVLRSGAAIAAAAVLAVVAPAAAHASTYPSDTAKPDLVSILSGYDAFWKPSGNNDLHGTVIDAKTLARNDRLVVWINQNATAAERFLAMQDSSYQNATGTAYDQSLTVSTGMGSVLGPLYVQGRNSGALPLTSALLNSSTGTSGAYVSTAAAKAAYSYPRPFLFTDATATAVTGDAAGCAPSLMNASSLQSNRVGKPYADAKGNLAITRVATVVDTTHQFSPNDVTLDASYGTTGLCTGGAFPSGHTTTAYEAGITLATLLPELAPELLARASENGNSRIVLGVHYPLDVIGGRISGEAAIAARWSDDAYRNGVLEPARAELVAYLEKGCGKSLTACIAAEQPYRSNPYGGKEMPGGSDQIVTNRRSAVEVYEERMTYGLPRSGTARLAPSVPAGAAALLRTTFPTLTDAQRTEVLAQTEIGSGYPLDGTGTSAGSWERIDLAAATSATVRIAGDGSVNVVRWGGTARVIDASNRQSDS